MKRLWTATAASLGCAALMATGCGGSDRQYGERAPQESSPPQTQQLTLVGCVQTGPAETRYVLENARHANQTERTTVPSGTVGPDEAASPFTEGSWVQLMARQETDLRQYVGQEVQVTGHLMGTDRTVGTGGARDQQETPAGARDQQTPTGERTRAADDKHHSARVAEEVGPIGQDSLARQSPPQMQVENVTPTGQQCQAKQHRQR